MVAKVKADATQEKEIADANDTEKTDKLADMLNVSETSENI